MNSLFFLASATATTLPKNHQPGAVHPLTMMILVWFLIIIMALKFLSFGSNGKLKQKVVLGLGVILCLLFLTSDILQKGPILGHLILTILFSIVILYFLKLRTNFCKTCGKTVRKGIFQSAKFCPHCGVSQTSEKMDRIP